MNYIGKTFYNGIYYINKYLSVIFIIEGVVLGMSALAADIPYQGLQIAEYWLFAFAGGVSYLSCRRTDLIWMALVLFIAAWGASTLEMRMVSGEISYSIWFVELVPVFLNALRYFWLVTDKAYRLAVPPKKVKVKRGNRVRMKSTNYRNRAAHKSSGRGTGDYVVDGVMERFGISEKQARARIRSCRRDLDAAMDDGYMEELEDIVAEQLGDSDYTDYLI